MRRVEADNTSTLFLIDFEYAARTLLYDLAAILTSTLGLRAIGKYFPSDAIIETAVKTYRREVRGCGSKPMVHRSRQNTELFALGSSEADEAVAVKQWVAQVKFPTLVSTLVGECGRYCRLRTR